MGDSWYDLSMSLIIDFGTTNMFLKLFGGEKCFDTIRAVEI